MCGCDNHYYVQRHQTIANNNKDDNDKNSSNNKRNENSSTTTNKLTLTCTELLSWHFWYKHVTEASSDQNHTGCMQSCMYCQCTRTRRDVYRRSVTVYKSRTDTPKKIVFFPTQRASIVIWCARACCSARGFECRLLTLSERIIGRASSTVPVSDTQCRSLEDGCFSIKIVQYINFFLSFSFSSCSFSAHV